MKTTTAAGLGIKTKGFDRVTHWGTDRETYEELRQKAARAAREFGAASIVSRTYDGLGGFSDEVLETFTR